MKKLTIDFISNKFKESHCELLESEYINAHTKMKYKCPCDHISYITWANFSTGKRCKKCATLKNISNQTHTQEYINEYLKQDGYTNESIYKSCMIKLKLKCPNNHICYISFHNYKRGHRCVECAGLKKHTQEYVDEYFKNENWTNTSIYKNNQTKLNVICPNNHKVSIRFNNFKNGQRCNICFRENNFGSNHPNWIEDRSILSLNYRLRKPHTKKWILKYMKHDPNYQKFLDNPNDYVVDHIIPVSLFCRIMILYNLNEIEIRNIINKKENLQLLTKEENFKKFNKGFTIPSAMSYLSEHGMNIDLN